MNALRLFEESKEKCGMRYTQYVSDGDCKVVKALNDRMPYGEGVKLKKTSCANHFNKTLRKRLGACGTT